MVHVLVSHLLVSRENSFVPQDFYCCPVNLCRFTIRNDPDSLSLQSCSSMSGGGDEGEKQSGGQKDLLSSFPLCESVWNVKCVPVCCSDSERKGFCATDLSVSHREKREERKVCPEQLLTRFS